MISKEILMKGFQKNPEKFWKVSLFDELGFERKRCKNCGKFFWSLSEEEICGDSSCRSYEFIGSKIKDLTFLETWKEIEKFFVGKNHHPLKRYPVICRWFPLYFTVAGIVNFCRLVDDRLDFEFPTNPSILAQPCLRFNDLPNTGLNSKSYSCFFMVQQTSLFDGKEGYWKDECINLDFELLTKVFGIDKEKIFFIEDVWLGPNAFGPSLEFHSQGLELGNAVFTQFEISNSSYGELDKKVIDMGAGLERFCWIVRGSLTSYDAVFENIIKKIGAPEIDDDLKKYFKLCGRINIDENKDLDSALRSIAGQINADLRKLKQKLEKLQAFYSVLDHSRALLFALADGGIPSNVAGGYNLRVILRRALNFLKKAKIELSLSDLIFMHSKDLKEFLPEMDEGRIEEILKIEESRYLQSKERSKRIVESYLKEGRIPSEEELIKLYDSNGITPEEFKEAGLDIEIPPNFYSKIVERHMREKEKKEEFLFDISNLKPTKLLFYEDPNILKFKAKVVKVFQNFVVLDQTAFYPTSGGQLCDKGFIDGIKVLDVKKVGNVVIHQLEKPLEEGKVVECEVDKERREILKRHHSATHVINYCARKVLGKHVWQYGSEKDVDKARLDITHFEKLEEWEEREIERLANEIVEKDLEVKIEFLERGEAERKYGFYIYQGGPAKEKILRIVSIGEEHEACGGLHCNSTKEIGPILILKSKRIADGIVRIEFCSGDVALNYLKESEKILEEVSKILNCKEEDVPNAVKKLFERWKKKMKEVKKLSR